MTPNVSVLVPCFRSAAFLRRALDSLLAQTFGAWEAVVVDNASDDGTHEIALEYAARDPRVRAYRNAENVGPVLNWRRCAELARAPLAGLLFSDDWYAPGFLASAVPLLAAPDVGFVYSAVRLVRDVAAAAQAPVHYSLRGRAVRPTNDYLRAIYGALTKADVPSSPGCALFRRGELVRWLALEPPAGHRDAWLAHGAGPDVLVYLQASLEYPRFAHLADPQVYFLAHEGNLSWRPDVQRAYAVALADFLERAAPRRGLAVAKARARLVDRLAAAGEGERSRELARRLGLLGRYKLARQRRRAARA
jgi:glycosyltransferase involved in cell wall biosynthesis